MSVYDQDPGPVRWRRYAADSVEVFVSPRGQVVRGMTHPLKWNVGDRCMHGGNSGVIRQIKEQYAAVEFDDEPYVTVDVHLSDLELKTLYFSSG